MVAIKTDLPDIFETIVGYIWGSEALQKAVSNYRKYFMSLSSRARISSQEARDARLEILRISKAKNLNGQKIGIKMTLMHYFLQPQLLRQLLLK